MRRFKTQNIAAQTPTVAPLPSAIGHVYLKPHLYEFICIREKLTSCDTVLYLDRKTLICKLLRQLCQTPDTFSNRERRKLDKAVYSKKVKFIPLDADAEQMKYLLDEQANRQFNELLHDLMIEFLQDDISSHLADQNKDGEARTAIENFTQKYHISDTEFGYEALKQAEYRLRRKRQ